MLARLFRHGASRQRIVKAYCFTERKSGEVATHLASEGVRLPCIDGATPALRLDPRRPNRVWIDTGNLWLHEPGVRKARFHEIQRVTEALADALGGVGGRLIPAGVRPPGERSWSTWLAGDQHFVEVLDDVEREVFCNLLRGVVPGLIAATGHAGLGERGASRTGSRRLAESTEHYATRYLASVSPLHLARVAQCLRREEGVQRLELMDVNPRGGGSGELSSVELRFVDAQMLLPTVRAMALAFQALAIRARRTVREGRRVGAISQMLLERNRARAIARGPRALLDLESEDDPRARRRQSTRDDLQQPVAAALVELVEDLRDEFQTLEATYEELSPLVLGLTLASMGHTAVCNESDLLGTWFHVDQAFRANYLGFLENGLRQAGPNGRDWLTAANETQFPDIAPLVRHRWETGLALKAWRPAPARFTRGTATAEDAAPRQEQTRRPPRQHSHGRTDERFGRDEAAPGSRPRPTATGQRAGGAPDVRRNDPAVAELLMFLKSLPPNAPPRARVAGLVKFQERAGTTDLDAALKRFDREQAREFRRLLRPARELRHWIGAEEIGADTPRGLPVRAADLARRHGLALVDFHLPAARRPMRALQSAD